MQVRTRDRRAPPHKEERLMSSILMRLAAAHRLLTREIHREAKRRSPNGERLARLKRERLAVKDRLARHLPVSEGFLRRLRRLLTQLRRHPQT